MAPRFGKSRDRHQRYQCVTGAVPRLLFKLGLTCFAWTGIGARTVIHLARAHGHAISNHLFESTGREGDLLVAAGRAGVRLRKGTRAGKTRRPLFSHQAGQIERQHDIGAILHFIIILIWNIDRPI